MAPSKTRPTKTYITIGIHYNGRWDISTAAVRFSAVKARSVEAARQAMEDDGNLTDATLVWSLPQFRRVVSALARGAR